MSSSLGLPDKYDECVESGAKVRTNASARRARERELERKRARGEISCAECRRLKLKCNKKIPCSSCIRRGCHTICPNGLLTTGQGSRFVLANTDKLHSKLLQMSQRIRQLEDALQIAQSSLSKAPHPLLSADLLAIKSGVDGLTNETGEKEVELEASADEEDLVISLGTLAVSESGASRFVGRTAAETLLINEPIEETSDNSHDSGDGDVDIETDLPELLVDAAKDFPLQYRHQPREKLIPLLLAHLPTYERATSLVEAYLENVSWLPRPVQREQIMENLLPRVYKGKAAELSEHIDKDGKYTGMHLMHTLALTFAVFACGAAADLTLPPCNKEGKLYHILAMAALNAHSVIGPGGASLETVQSFILIAQYDFFSGAKSTLEPSWKIISFGLIIAASIGLHRDPVHWNMEPKYIQRRRSVFWEIFALDKFKSLGTGRPSVFHLQEIDCEFPEDDEAFVDENGKTCEGPKRWRYRFVKEVIGPMSEALCSTKPVKYSMMLDWDRRIREFGDVPVPLRCRTEGTKANLRIRMWSLLKEIGLLSIHRNFFAKAMIENPENPLRSPFAPSFLAAYAVSIKVIRQMRSGFEQINGLVLRLFPAWAHCLTCGVIVGSVAVNTDQLSLAKAAFQELNVVIKLFQDGSVHPVCRQGLPILLRLRERARIALQKMVEEVSQPSGTVVSKVEQDGSDELIILRGAPRLVHRKRTHGGATLGSPVRSKSSGTSNSSSSPSPVVPAPPSLPGSMGQYITQAAPATSDPSAVFPSQMQSSNQPSSSSVTSDLATLFNAIYNRPADASSSSSTARAPDPHAFLFGDQSQQASGQQEPPFNFGFETSQSAAPSTGGSYLGSNNWMSDATQLEAILAQPYGEIPAIFDKMQTVAAVPSTDVPVSWVPVNGPACEDGFSGDADATQFMEAWRLQAAIEGAHFLPDSDQDSRMSF